MKNSRVIFIIVILLVAVSSLGYIVISSSQQSCHESIGQVALDYLATKRPYNYNRENDDASRFIPEGCAPVKLWYFGRHGTRYPGKDDIEQMQLKLPGLHREILAARNATELCPQTLQYFSGWHPRPDLNVSMDTYLHTQGKYELSSISARYVSRFPQLFPNQFTNSSYHFKFTDSQRTNASAHSFASSIFGEEMLDMVYFPKPLSKDPVLKFYSVCPKWKYEVDDNPEANKEHDLFIKSAFMNKTISKVSRRVGLARNFTLEEVTLMYTTCAYETGWNNGTFSEWCVLFDLDDFKVMAYREDLEYYWKDGYGFRINWEQACPPFLDAVNFFKEYPDGDGSVEYRKVQAYFSHSGANLKMLARLGLFKDGDDPAQMRSDNTDNFEEMKDIYKWRTSRIDFMASNIAMAMYTCNNSGTSSKQIGLFFQETPTGFPICEGNAFCSYDQFMRRMEEFTNNCTLEDICRI